MSRSGYDDECDGWQLIMYRGRVASATRGQRGQRLFRDMLVALVGMESKRLIAHSMEACGHYCALGALGIARGIEVGTLDPEDSDGLAVTFDIAESLAREVMYMNDEADYSETNEQRWTRMRAWVESQIKKPA